MKAVNDSGLIHHYPLPKTLHYFSQYTKKQIKRDTFFLIEGDDLQDINFLEKGIIALSCRNEKSTKTILFQSEHSLINDIHMLSESPQAFLRGYAFTNLELRSMPYKDFSYYLDNDDEFFLEILLCIGERTQKLMYQLYNLRFNTAEERLNDFLKEFNQFCMTKKLPKPLLSQKRIAEALALHRVTVAKTLKEFGEI